MKKQILFAGSLALLAIAFVFNGCIKDTVKRTYTYTLYRPVYKTTEAVRANIKSDAAVSVQQPGKLFIQGNYIFLNELDKGVHVIDNSNPAQPKNAAFIAIPGNVDVAVKGHTLYADLYTDLVTIDIADPMAAKVTKIVENVFPQRTYTNGINYYGYDSSLMVTDWVVKDTTVTEETSVTTWNRIIGGGGVVMLEDGTGAFAMSKSSAPTPGASTATGTSGSLARFTIVGNRLYTVGTHELTVFNISNAALPAYASVQDVGFGIETIYPFKDQLFIGSTNGMFIYSISNADQPKKMSQFTHVQSCDPVIADGDFAFVTLRSGTRCNGFTNELEVLNIANLSQPFQVQTYALTHPAGLSKDGNLLFVCDDIDGLKVYNASKPDALQLLQTINTFNPYDVIASNGLAIVVAKDGLYQFDYSNPAAIKQLSKLTLK